MISLIAKEHLIKEVVLHICTYMESRLKLSSIFWKEEMGRKWGSEKDNGVVIWLFQSKFGSIIEEMERSINWQMNRENMKTDMILTNTPILH